MFAKPGRNAYRIGSAVAILAGALQIWMNLAVGIVGNEDNPVNLGFYLIVLAAAACAFTARLQAEAMARAMLAVAAMQVLLALVIATAPSTARDDPHGVMIVLVLSGIFATLWLGSAAAFQRSARAGGVTH